MINKYLYLFFFFFVGGGVLSAQTALEGKIIDQESGEPIILAQVALYKDGVLISGAESDFDGNYSVGNIDGGTFDVEASYVGFSPKRITDVVITNGRVTRLDFELGQGIDLEGVEIIEYKKPLIEIDNTSSGGALTSDDIEKLSTKNINALASLTAGLASTDGGDINARGSRSSGTDFYLDGIRVSGDLIPQSEIEQLTSIVGGVPASFGDVTGAVISLTSKGPSSKLSGGLEVETSELFDDYGYNLISANVSGPILKKEDGNSVIGFRLSGQYLKTDDSNPSALGVYRSSEEYINQIAADPLSVAGNPNAEFDRLASNGGSIELLEARPNETDKQLNLTAKLDFRIADAIDLSISGGYIDEENRFTPGGLLTNSTRATYNWTRNPYSYDNVYRGNMRIRHRLGQGNKNADEGDGESKSSAIQNVSYTITGGFQRAESSDDDLIHKDNLWNYGYVGEFDVNFAPNTIFDFDSMRVVQEGFAQGLEGYRPNANINPAWVALNAEDDLDKDQISEFNAFNGQRSNILRTAWGYHDLPGAIYNRSYKDQRDRYTLDVRTNFDFVPGSSEKGRHSFEIGFLYEQRESRIYRLRPRGLWTEARSLANVALIGSGLNYDKEFGEVELPDGTIVTTYYPLVAGGTQKNFHHKLRDALGKGYDEFVNIDAILPGDMDLAWFEPEELTRDIGSARNLLDFYGYDYLGNKLGADVTFDDFFADADNDGKQDFQVAPFQPNLLAAFIQDRFSYKDLIFRIGVRMERYDANTKVLKDPYSLYEIKTAGEARADGLDVADNVSDDLLVYRENSESDVILAYREGEQWYNASGQAVNDGRLIFGGGPVNPLYKNPDATTRDIKSTEFVSQIDGSFEDYEPEINFAPRLSFSFPISEASNFSANYDVLYQRPTAGVIYTALDYFYFEEEAANRTINENPNLKPQQTTQYEIGFQQKVSNTSAIKIQAYYKEERNRVQARTLQQVATPIGSYTTYDNIDFATIKGFSFTYDLRRTGNLLALANYTLQFADGTGSDSQTQRTLSSNGRNIRTLSALNFDERHRFNLNLDYRYGSGKKYNGPTLFGSQILANAGANVQLTAVSGRPFTRAQNPTEFGGTGFSGALNESRRPWTYNVDLRVDKDFAVGGGEGKKPLTFNVYLRVQNLLDTRNVVGVYRFTADPEDSGFLAHPNGQNRLNNIRELDEQGLGTEESFLDLYRANLLNPGFYALPRRIYLGAYFNF